MMDESLLYKCLNFHGQQLTNFLQSDPLFKSLRPRSLEYVEYKARSNELRLEDRGKRLLLHRFIAENAKVIFDRKNVAESEVEPATQEVCGLVPPVETFLNLDKEARINRFFEYVDKGDVLFCTVGAKNTSGLLLNVKCFSLESGKSRTLDDLKIKSFCPAAEMIPADDPRDSNRGYSNNDYVCAVVFEIRRDSQRLLMSMKKEHLPEKWRESVKLGLVTQSSQLPESFIRMKHAYEKDLSYTHMLEASNGFRNPSNVTELAKELGLSSKGGSLLNGLKGGYPEDKCAPNLRRKQNFQWALGHVSAGVKHFKAGRNVEAFQCLNQALKIDPENVEGLVARGALYANSGSLEKAISDFEEALKFNSKHKNATKYMCETLVALARGQEDGKKLEEAIETYEKILTYAPDYREALDSIRYLKRKLNPEEESNVVHLDIADIEVRSNENPPLNRSLSKSPISSISSMENGRSKSLNEDIPPGMEGPVGGDIFSQFNNTALATNTFTAPVTIPGSTAVPESSVSKGYPPSYVPVTVQGQLPYTSYPPPAMAYSNPGPSNSDDAYNKAVEKFLQDTAARPNKVKPRSRSRSRDRHKRGRGYSIERENRKRPRSRSRSRHRSKSPSRHRKRSRSSSEERRRSRKSKKRSRSRSRERRNRSKSTDRRRSRKDSEKSKSKRDKEDNKSDDTVEKLMDLGLKGSMDVDVFAERLSEFFAESNKILGKNKKKDEIEEKVEKEDGEQNVFVDGLDIKVKNTELKKQQEKSRKPNSPVFHRVASPGVRAVFDMNVNDSPVSLSSEEESNDKGKDKEIARSSRTINESHSRPINPNLNQKFVVKLNPDTGMYLRVAASPPEQRIIRKVSLSPKRDRDYRGRRSRSNSPRNDRSYQRGSRKSRSRSRDLQDLRSTTLDIQRQREAIERERVQLLALQRGGRKREDSFSKSSGSVFARLSDPVEESRRQRSRSRGTSRRRSRSRSGRRSRSRNGRRSRSRGRKRSRSRSRSRDRRHSRDMTGRDNQRSRWADDNAYMDNVMDSVLEAVEGKPTKPSNIIPGTKSFEDLEKFLDKAKRQKKNEMLERNKGFIKPKHW